MFLCRQRLFLVGPPSEIFGAKKGGAAFLFVLRAYGCRSTCWSRKRRIFRRLEFLFVCFFEKKRPKPNVEINATFPRIPNPQPDVFPPIKPPPPYTTSHHQHPPTPHLQIPSVPPAHPSCAHKVQEHEAQLEQCKATGKAEKDATKGIKDLQKNAIRVFLDPTPTSGFSKLT